MAIQTVDNKYGVAKWIVDPVLGRGTHTTIATALTSASSGDTIFIRPGTYIENLTLKAGVDLAAFIADAFTPNVTISGNATATFAGTASISGINLQTNSAACLTISGSAATIINLRNCNINCTNSTGITFSTSSASAQLNIESCRGDIGTTGIAYLTHSSAGFLKIQNCRLENSGASTTANSISAGSTNFSFSSIFNPFAFSGTSSVTCSNAFFNTKLQNVTCITTSNTSLSTITVSTFESGTASAVSIGVGSAMNLQNCTVNTTNTNALTGAGTIFVSNIGYGSSQTNNVTTQTGGVGAGNRVVAPSAGFIGERLETNVGTGTPVSLVSGASKTVATVSLTAGVWDVSTICVINGTLATRFLSGPSLVTNTLGVGGIGIDQYDTPTSPTAAAGSTGVVPVFRFVLTTTTNVFMVAQATFTGSANASGRISATRVG